jgi:lipopolysaccharide export system permease protein
LYLYLTRQVLATLGMTAFVFTFVLLLGNVLKQILELVVKGQASLGLAAHAILLLIPFVLAFSLPIGMLTAALLVFGRLSADQELTAARASGISLVSLVAPVLGISVLVSAFCAWLNFDLAPASRVAYKALLNGAAVKTPGKLIRPNTYVPFGKYIFFAGRVQSDGTNLEDVRIFEWNTATQLVRRAEAPRAELSFDSASNQIAITMSNMTSQIRDEHGWAPGPNGYWPLTAPFSIQTGDSALEISEMTFRQLRAQLALLERGSAPILPHNPTPAQLDQARRSQGSSASDLAMPLLVCLNQQVAFSFACIGFTLIGIPLAIRAHRRETSAGVAMALVLVLINYSFMVLGQAWENHPERYPCLIVWLPNFVFQAVGIVLLWRINRKVG